MKTKEVYTVSDLHLFCRRSEAHRHMRDIHGAAAKADIFVLNGDTFDFRWSCHGSTVETARKAIGWLEELTARSPDCFFHVVLGNHDHVGVFIDELHEFAERTHNLAWHPYYVKVGDTLFLHGDVANRRMTAADLERYRETWLHEESRGELVNTIFDVAFRAGVHQALTKFAFPTSVVVERIRHYLDDIGEGAGSDTDVVFFGHTHTAVDNYEFGGQRFFNSGAPMRGLNFNILGTRICA